MSLLTDFFPKSRGSGGVDSRKPNAEIALVAGGGGSGASPGDMTGASGGEILRGCIHLLAGCTYPVIIGAGGAVGGTDPTCLGLPTGVGSPGGSTSFGKYRAFGGAGASTSTQNNSPLETACADACTFFTYAYSSTNNGLGGSGAFSLNDCQHVNTLQHTCAVRFCRNGVVVGNIQTLHGCENNNTFVDLQVYPLFDHASLFGSRQIVGIETAPTSFTMPPPGAQPYDCTCKITTCNAHYGLCIGGAPHAVCTIGDQVDCYNVNLECIGFQGHCYKFGIQSRYSSRLTNNNPAPTNTGRCMELFMQPNFPNMGTAAKCKGCSGDSGIAVIVYDCSLGAATAPGALDCTPITGPQGYRSYVFEGPGTFTLPS